jgi:hypothetical protein
MQALFICNRSAGFLTRVRFRLMPSRQFWSASYSADKKASYIPVLFEDAVPDVLILILQSCVQDGEERNNHKMALTVSMLASHYPPSCRGH